MGTNYYWEYDRCEKCNRSERLHIGKSSAGWVFCFQGYLDKGLIDWPSWRDYLSSSEGRIIDENGTFWEFLDFQSVVLKRTSRGCLPPGTIVDKYSLVGATGLLRFREGYAVFDGVADTCFQEFS